MIIDDTKNPATRPSAIESAIAHIERSLCPNGTGHEGIPEGERAGYEWRAIFRWAERESLVIPPQLAPERVGGREHDLTFLPLERRWRKFTKPDGCGLMVDFVDGCPLLLPGTPLQYLKRLQLQNSFWGDDIRLEGVQIMVPGAKIVTTQPDVKGEAPTQDFLNDYLCGEFGFRKLKIPPMGYYKSHSYLHGRFAMFDVHPANFVQVSSKVVLPIDVIMMECEGVELAALEAAL